MSLSSVKTVANGMTTNGVNRGEQVERDPFADRRIKGYRRGPMGGTWYWHPALRDGHFQQYDVPAMIQDNAIALGVKASLGPLMGAKFDVRANSREIKTFIENTLYRFWHHDLFKIFPNYFCRGTAVAEVLYEQDQDSGYWKYAGMDDFEPIDVQALRRGRQLTGVRVSAGGLSLPIIPATNYSGTPPALWNTLRPPKIYWAAQSPYTTQLFGNSAFIPSWNPWMEKCGAHGAISIRKLWGFGNAFRGVLIKFPPGQTQRSDGTIVNNQDIAREMAENAATGAAQYCPSGCDEQGHPLWEIIDPKQNGSIKELMDYPENLDKAIWQGMGLLDEVIRAPDTGGSWSGRSGPLLIFLNICDMRVKELLTAFDLGANGLTTRNESAGGVIRSLCLENFGPTCRYSILPISLVPKPVEPGAGGTGIGGAPGQPSAPPMGAQGPSKQVGKPMQPMGKRPFQLSGLVTLPDDAVTSILTGVA